MSKVLVFVMIGLAVLAFGAVAVAVTAPSVSAEETNPNCGGTGQPSCTQWCIENPSRPECRS